MARCDLALLTEGERMYVEMLHGQSMIDRFSRPWIDKVLESVEVRIEQALRNEGHKAP